MSSESRKKKQAVQGKPVAKDKPAKADGAALAPGRPEGSRAGVPLAAAMLVLAAVAAYHNSFDCPFILDDDASILQNPTIHSLWPLGPVLSPPCDAGQTVGGRPIVNLSLAVNYALGETAVQGYHQLNLAIHILAALTLFGTVRRTLLLPSMRERFGPASTGLSLAVALLWCVHPLLTESVTYTVQRAESLMGLFYLLTLYCVIRSSKSRPVVWSLAAVLACAAGMATKEVMVTAPVMVLLYDRIFLAGSFRQAMRRRWGLYAGLAACWGVLAYLMTSAGSRGQTMGFGATTVVSWWSYLRMECWAVLHYLRLAFWPDSLCLHYGRQITRTTAEVLPGAVVLSLLAAATIWGLWRGREWAFPVAWFLGILAPTSSVVPIIEFIAEHRMYLPLAGVVSAAVLGAFVLWRKLAPKIGWLSGVPVLCRRGAAWAVLVAATVAMGYLTIARNHDYRSTLAIWEDTVKKAPGNSLAHMTLGTVLSSRGQSDPAIEQFRQAIALTPALAEAHYNLGVTLYRRGDADGAIAEYRRAIRLDPRHALSRNNLGYALLKKRQYEEAIVQLRLAILLDPRDAYAYENLALALRQTGRAKEAMEVLQRMPRR